MVLAAISRGMDRQYKQSQSHTLTIYVRHYTLVLTICTLRGWWDNEEALTSYLVIFWFGCIIPDVKGET